MLGIKSRSQLELENSRLELEISGYRYLNYQLASIIKRTTGDDVERCEMDAVMSNMLKNKMESKK